MRRSTALNMKHRSHTVAKLYSAFVRAMTRCAGIYGGEIRGIIGDRVLMLFDPAKCFTNAIDTAILINSVCQYVLNKHFKHNEVSFGIGIDFGTMLATKTGIRRHGSAQQSYRALVWLGRPAKIASKLTDNANKPEEVMEFEKVNVAYNSFFGLTYVEEWPSEFVSCFTRNTLSGLMVHSNPAFHSFTTFKRRYVTRPATPAILLTKVVYDGFCVTRSEALEIKNGWFKKIDITIPEHRGEVYGGDVIFSVFNS